MGRYRGNPNSGVPAFFIVGSVCNPLLKVINCEWLRVTFNTDPGPMDRAPITAQSMGAMTCTLPLHTLGTLEVVSHGVCHLPAGLIAQPCPQSACHHPLALNCQHVCQHQTPPPHNVAHPDEDERMFRAPGRSRYTIHRCVHHVH